MSSSLDRKLGYEKWPGIWWENNNGNILGVETRDDQKQMKMSKSLGFGVFKEHFYDLYDIKSVTDEWLDRW